nr:hypothetical protein B0A51_12768 [Rachicladosporium sp. CCFEE 5018]
MPNSKPKQFTRPPPKKVKAKSAEPQTADDFQEAADFEEEAGGKWRAGDPAKSARAFTRALELYERGLSKHPQNFDLAYNKARLMLELSQQPALVPHIAASLETLLHAALEDHRKVLRLDEENVDALFNTAQVLTRLAEVLHGEGDEDGEKPAELLHEALEVLSACLSKQEMMFEQQRIDSEARFEEMENDDGVSVTDPMDASTSSSATEEQTATIVAPIAATDLIDTVHASLAALTTLVAIDDSSEFDTLANMAAGLTEDKAPRYIALLPESDQGSARLSTALDRAIFFAGLTDARFSAYKIDLRAAIEQLQVFNFRGKETSAHALFAEAQARQEVVLTALDREVEAGYIDGVYCWGQLTAAQTLLSAAAGLGTDDARERKARIYELKADTEILRYRFATMHGAGISDAIHNSAATLLSNARTFYKGAMQLGRVLGDEEIVKQSSQRAALFDALVRISQGGSATTGDQTEHGVALGGLVEDGLLDDHCAEEMYNILQSS